MKDKVTAIILAAGRGSRMKSDIQKQFMLLGGYPIIYYSLKTFEDSRVDDIILVTGENDIEFCRKEIVERYNITKVNKIIAGGKERYESVCNAVEAADKSKYVIIHDGARPFVTCEMIDASIENVKKHKACTVGVPVKDTIKIVDSQMFGKETPSRRFLYQIQTPQSFETGLLADCYKKFALKKRDDITDDTMLVECYSNVKCKVIEGSYDNIKITTPEDLKIAENFLKIC